MRGEDPDKTCLSWWFPRIESAGLPVPKTKILRFDDVDATRRDFFEAFDGKPLGPKAVRFVQKMRNTIAEHFTFPVFLRTGQTSGKHEWESTCFVKDMDSVEHHMLMLIQFSEMADMMGLPWDVWVVREFLSLRHFGTMPEFLNMPLAPEWRLFVEDAKITHIQPYWPVRALVQGGVPLNRARELFMMQRKLGCPLGLYKLSLKAAAACGQNLSWSVDWCETEKGEWILTDMAEAASSFKYMPSDPAEMNVNEQEIPFKELLKDMIEEKPSGKPDPA